MCKPKNLPGDVQNFEFMFRLSNDINSIPLYPVLNE